MIPGAKLGVGLLGCGAFGRFCLREVYCDAGAARSRRGRRNPGGRAQDGRGICRAGLRGHPRTRRARRLQIIHIATPPSTHRELAVAALDAGKHVLCEKPLATTLADARRMIDAARTARRFLAVNLIMKL